MIGPDPLRDRILSALRLEPMSGRDLALVLTVSRDIVADELAILHARGEIRRLTMGNEWIRAPRLHLPMPQRIAA